ncbi:MAG: hypothetical protein B6D46_14580 [Polyangiaceae bacterium UTPRO1]|nr:MAG: hypothetical protein B6D46_14580 [Polyangiaceae bacterium UTPRO1]
MGKSARRRRERMPPTNASAPAVVPGPWPTWPAGESARWPSIALVVGIALVARVVALAAMTATPYLRIDNIDARSYHAWANGILAGAWLPAGHFYQSPVYAYYLAVVAAFCGDSPWPPRVIQALLGAASTGLLTVIGATIFDRRVGVIAGLLLAIYGPMILEEISLGKTSLLVFGSLVGFMLFLRALAARRGDVMVAAGLVLGVTVIGVGQWLPALLGLALYTGSGSAAPKHAARRLAACFLGGALLALAPLILWNSWQGGGLMLTSGDAGLNLYLGNNPLTTGLSGRPQGLRDVPEFEEGDSRRLAERDAGHALTPAGVSRHWARKAVGWAAAHPGDFVATTAKKIAVLWNSYEIPDSYHFAFIRAQYMSWLWAGTSFAIVGPLGLLGLVLAVRHRPARPLYVVCLGYLGVVALFYVRSRYRMPAVPFLMVFAAAVVDWTIRILPREDWRPLAVLAAGLVVAGFFVNHPYCEPAIADAPALCLDGDVWFDGEWQKLAEAHERSGDLAAALADLGRAAATESQRSPGQTQLWIGRLEVALAEGASGAAQQSHLAAALPALERAIGHGFHVWEAAAYLATAQRLSGRPEEALAASRRAVQARPHDPHVLMQALRLRAALGRCDSAAEIREELRRLQPRNIQADAVLASCRSGD